MHCQGLAAFKIAVPTDCPPVVTQGVRYQYHGDEMLVNFPKMGRFCATPVTVLTRKHDLK